MDEQKPEVVDLADIEGAYGLGPEPPNIGLKDGVIKCASCIGRYLTTVKDKAAGVQHDGQDPMIPPVNDAVTWLPSWQSQQIQGQIVMACVALPTCMGCCGIKEETPVERATKSGLALPGPGGSIN